MPMMSSIIANCPDLALPPNILDKSTSMDKITGILFWEDETMGLGAKIIIGGLNSWEVSTQHMTRAGDDGLKQPPISIRCQVSERQNIIREKTSPLQPTNQLLQPVFVRGGGEAPSGGGGI